MQDFSKRHAKRQILLRFVLSVAGLILLVLIAFVAVRAAYRMYGKFAQAAESAESAQERFTSLREQKNEVGAVVEAFDSSRGIEAEIRERYGVAKPGEGKIEIVRDSASSSPRSAAPSNLFVRFFEFLWPF